MNDTNYSRRSFLRVLSTVAAAAPAVALVARGAAAQEGGALPPVDEASPLATSLGFKHKAAESPKRTPEKEKQFCHNCMLFAQGGLKAEGKEGEFGKCTLFPQNVVSADGWCASWVQKPGSTL